MENRDPEVVKRMDEWAHRIADKILPKEMDHVPAAVQALACVYHLAALCRDDDTILRPEQMVAILIKETSYDEDGTFEMGAPVRNVDPN